MKQLTGIIPVEYNKTIPLKLDGEKLRKSGRMSTMANETSRSKI